jgi:hypothetical protein
LSKSAKPPKKNISSKHLVFGRRKEQEKILQLLGLWLLVADNKVVFKSELTMMRLSF